MEVPGQALDGVADQKMSGFFVSMPLAKALKTNCALQNKKEVLKAGFLHSSYCKA